jgi:K+-sensing histidine kinase KdpD
MVLVCATNPENYSRLIYAGLELSLLQHLPLKVICVRPKDDTDWLASKESESLFNLSANLGAELVVIFHDSASEAVDHYIQHQEVGFVLVGMPPQVGQSVFISELEDHFPELPIISIDEHGLLQLVPATREYPGD